MDIIDLRSDTVSWPTPEMREAMANAVVGDDVYGEDPTVNELQAAAAAMLGKEAALFVTSGTMGNLTAVMTHCQRGDEIILGREAHIFLYEAGGSAALAGVQASTIPVEADGTLNLESIRKAIRPGGNPHFPHTRLVCLENTQGSRAGMPISAEYTAQVGELAHEHGLKLHIDGARIFNAATALGVDVKALVAPADSISFCLSKGLCAPAGSLLVGSREFIDRAVYTRKILGGGMRQVGVLAAAGLVALRKMTKRLGEDHANACRLAEGLATIPHIEIDPTAVHTNMILFSINDDTPIAPDELVQRLREDHNIVIGGYSNGRDKIRFVTHYWITPERVDTVLEAMRELLA
ncbi:MAG: low-specificity L-threonine aldolase [Anaerolineae bacterium]|nr:low-specificity L-threonine aldolase [Anaerolineae bacterium]